MNNDINKSSPLRVLMLAPHPFYQDRGTPIAVDMMLRVTSGLGIRTDLVTFPEGEDRDYEGVRIFRVDAPGRPRNVRPGFSLRKLYLDWFLFLQARRLVRQERYDIIHAVEESAFIAMFFRRYYRLPYIYDMDSMMSDQLLARHRVLGMFGKLFRRLERRIVRGASAVAPMCDDLANRVRGDMGDGDLVVVKDVSLVQADDATGVTEDLRTACEIHDELALYVGNLEPYQGIDLLLEAFVHVVEKTRSANLVIIGGAKQHIEIYSELANRLGIAAHVHLIGPRPVEYIGSYLGQADVLVSPRSEGTNTPMKIYSYLHSGVPLVATRLPTHTQVLDDGNSVLTVAEPRGLADGIVRVLSDREYGRRLGEQARNYAEREHGMTNFRESVGTLYRCVESRIGRKQS